MPKSIQKTASRHFGSFTTEKYCALRSLCTSLKAPLCRRSKSLQSCPTLCDLMDCSPPGSSVHGILQARTLECIAISFSRRSSQPRDWEDFFLFLSSIAGGFFAFWITRESYPFIHFPNCTDVWSHLIQGSMGTLIVHIIHIHDFFPPVWI